MVNKSSGENLQALQLCLRSVSSGYIAVFISPATWAFYLTSVLIGVGAASESTHHRFPTLELQRVTESINHPSSRCLFILYSCHSRLHPVTVREEYSQQREGLGLF